MFGNPDKKITLSPALQSYYVQKGFESAMQMNEDVPMVLFMRAEIARLVTSATFLEDPSQVVQFWDKGFTQGIIRRVHGWKDAPLAECRDTIRMTGTLRTVKGRKP